MTSPDELAGFALLDRLTPAQRTAVAGAAEPVLIPAGMRFFDDLLSVYRRRDVNIRDEIISKVIAGEFGIDPDSLEVTVRSGIVTVAGEISESRIAVDLLAAIRHVEGVVNVRSQFSFPIQALRKAHTERAS